MRASINSVLFQSIEVRSFSAMIKFENVSKVYSSGQSALKGISFSVTAGEFAFIAGASGAGKSTLLKMIFGEIAPTSGHLKVMGQDVPRSASELVRLRRRVGVVFQDYKLLPRLNVSQNVGFPLEVLGIAAERRKARVGEVLETVGLAHKHNSLPYTLSGGEQQRVAIARAIVNRPNLLIADEPTGNVDSEMAQQIFDIFLEANRSGTTVLVASHDLHLIQKLDKRAILLENGRVLYDSAQSIQNKEVECS